MSLRAQFSCYDGRAKSNFSQALYLSYQVKLVINIEYKQEILHVIIFYRNTPCYLSRVNLI